MDTIIITGGFISPRYYQVPQDKIEAKQAMEPMSIATGAGPVVGFNIVDTSATNVRLTGTANSDVSLVNVRNARKNSEPKTSKISVNGQPGTVVNAHITPSGLLSIDPVWIDTGIAKTTIASAHTFIVVKARLDYTAEIENNIENIPAPSNNNFICNRVTNWVHNGVNITGGILAGYTFRDMEAALVSGGVTLDHSKEVLIGVYEFNPPETVRNEDAEFYLSQGTIIPLIPYYYIWPPMVGNDTRSYALVQFLKGRVEWIIENLNPEVNTPQIVDGAVTAAKLAANSVTTAKIVDGAVTAQKLASNSVSTVKIQDNAITSEKIGTGAVNNLKIADGAVSTTKIVNNAITSEKISGGSIISNRIADGAVTAQKLASNAVTTPKLDTGAVTPSKWQLNPTAVSGSSISNTRNLLIECTRTNLYPTLSIILQGDENVIVPITEKMNLNVSGFNSFKVQRSGTTINSINPTVKTFTYTASSGENNWVDGGTYSLTFEGTILTTANIPLNTIGGIGKIVIS